MILKNNLKASAEREYYEDRYICLLGTKQPHGLNQDVSAFANEMYDYVQLLHWRHDVIKLVKKTLYWKTLKQLQKKPKKKNSCKLIFMNMVNWSPKRWK